MTDGPDGVRVTYRQGHWTRAMKADHCVATLPPHLMARIPHNLGAPVQNALQSSLRDAGLAWGVHEFNEALVAALDHPGAAAAWWAGDDPLAPARCADVPAAEQAAVFDELRPAAAC